MKLDQHCSPARLALNLCTISESHANLWASEHVSWRVHSSWPHHMYVCCTCFSKYLRFLVRQWAEGFNVCPVSRVPKPEPREVCGLLSRGPALCLPFFLLVMQPQIPGHSQVWCLPALRGSEGGGRGGCWLYTVLCFFLSGLWEQRERFIKRSLGLGHLVRILCLFFQHKVGSKKPKSFFFSF